MFHKSEVFWHGLWFSQLLRPANKLHHFCLINFNRNSVDDVFDHNDPFNPNIGDKNTKPFHKHSPILNVTTKGLKSKTSCSLI